MLVHPKFDHILSGCTSLRLLELAQKLVKSGQLKDVKVADITLKDALAAKEMLLIGSSVKVTGIVQWDEHTIGNGKPGPIASALLDAPRGRHAIGRSPDRCHVLATNVVERRRSKVKS